MGWRDLICTLRELQPQDHIELQSDRLVDQRIAFASSLW